MIRSCRLDVRTKLGRPIVRNGWALALVMFLACDDPEAAAPAASAGAAGRADAGRSGAAGAAAEGGSSNGGNVANAGNGGTGTAGIGGVSGAGAGGASGQGDAGTAGASGLGGSAGAAGAISCSVDACATGFGQCCAFRGGRWNAAAKCWGATEIVGCYDWPTNGCGESSALSCYVRGEGAQQELVRATGIFGPASLTEADGWKRCEDVPGVVVTDIAADCPVGTGGAGGAGGAGDGGSAGAASCAFDAAGYCSGAPPGGWCCGVAGTLFDIDAKCWRGEPASSPDIGPVAIERIACGDGLCVHQTAPGCYRMTYEGRDVRIWSNSFIITLPASVVGESDLRKCTNEERMARAVDEARPICP